MYIYIYILYTYSRELAKGGGVRQARPQFAPAAKSGRENPRN